MCQESKYGSRYCCLCIPNACLHSHEPANSPSTCERGAYEHHLTNWMVSLGKSATACASCVILQLTHLCEWPVIVGHAQQARRGLVHLAVGLSKLEGRKSIWVRFGVPLRRGVESERIRDGQCRSRRCANLAFGGRGRRQRGRHLHGTDRFRARKRTGAKGKSREGRVGVPRTNNWVGYIVESGLRLVDGCSGEGEESAGGTLWLVVNRMTVVCREARGRGRQRRRWVGAIASRPAAGDG